MIYQNFVNAYEETFEKYSKILARTAIGLARISQSSRVLDAGCGNGSVSEILSEKLVEIYGIDLSPSMISRACMRNINNSVFQQGNCLSLPFSDSFFDFYFGNLIINNVKSPEKLIQEAFRVLKEGGKIMITYPLHKSSNDIIKIMKNSLREAKIGSKSQKTPNFLHFLKDSQFRNIRKSTISIGLNLKSGMEACNFLSPIKEIKQLEKVKKKQEVLENIEKKVEVLLGQGICLIFEISLITAEK